MVYSSGFSSTILHQPSSGSYMSGWAWASGTKLMALAGWGCPWCISEVSFGESGLWTSSLCGIRALDSPSFWASSMKRTETWAIIRGRVREQLNEKVAEPKEDELAKSEEFGSRYWLGFRMRSVPRGWEVNPMDPIPAGGCEGLPRPDPLRLSIRWRGLGIA